MYVAHYSLHGILNVAVIGRKEKERKKMNEKIDRGVIQVTLAHQKYWEFEVTVINGEVLSSAAGLSILWILRNVNEDDLWIVEYNDDVPYNEPGHLTEWFATPRDFDWRLLTGTNEQRKWRNVVKP